MVARIAAREKALDFILSRAQREDSGQDLPAETREEGPSEPK
jgi:hypothetical protein